VSIVWLDRCKGFHSVVEQIYISMCIVWLHICKEIHSMVEWIYRGVFSVVGQS